MKSIGPETLTIANKPDHEVLNLFSVPLYKADIGVEVDEKKILMGEKKWVGQEDGILIQSEDDQVLNLEGIERIKNEISKHIKQYIELIINPLEDDTEFLITQSWVNIINEGFHHKHRHQNSILSGVYYVNTYENCGNIKFHDFSTTRNQFKIAEYNKLNSPEFFIEPVNDKIILFPAEVYHQVAKNNSNKDRYSIAFNIIPTGEIGEADSKLIIKD